MTILDEILERKRMEVAAAKERIDEAEMAARAAAVVDVPRGFRRALIEGEAPVIIAEVKRRSPSKGEIRADFDPVACAQEYAANGAAAISVLTDEHYFGGHLDYLAKIRAAVPQPLLRKEFIVDAYQIDEARAFGADAILLIVSALTGDALGAFDAHARSLGLDVLVEVHDEAELDAAVAINADLVGVNNRNLKTFVTELTVTESLAGRLATRLAGSGDASTVLVAESGIGDLEDIRRLERVGASAFLVGESLMRESDVGRALRRLRGMESAG